MRSMRSRQKSSKGLAVWLALLILAILALKGLIVVSQYLGYAASIGAQAGTITELVITESFPTDYWAAVYGVAVRVSGYNNQQRWQK